MPGSINIHGRLTFQFCERGMVYLPFGKYSKCPGAWQAINRLSECSGLSCLSYEISNSPSSSLLPSHDVYAILVEIVVVKEPITEASNSAAAEYFQFSLVYLLQRPVRMRLVRFL
jgi:hypothetical protein